MHSHSLVLLTGCFYYVFCACNVSAEKCFRGIRFSLFATHFTPSKLNINYGKWWHTLSHLISEAILWERDYYYLLWWKIHNIQLTILTLFECISQWHQVSSHCCITITMIEFQNFLIFPNENAVLIILTSHFTSSPLPPGSGNHYYTLRLYAFAWSRHLL